MSLDFVHEYGGRRVNIHADAPLPFGAPGEGDEEEVVQGVNQEYELDADDWKPRAPVVPDSFRPEEWPDRPVRFVDGKDVGQTVAWLQAPHGFPIPVRLSQIGSTVVELEDGRCRRRWHAVERVVSMVVDPFPWDEVEGFAEDLHAHGIRLLPAIPINGKVSYDVERNRKAAQNKSNDEMGLLEEAAIAQNNLLPTIVDGRLEPRQGGIDPEHSPAVGLVKSHRQIYLDAAGMQVMYGLRSGERTPVFALEERSFPVVSWYLRLSAAGTALPTRGLVRVELSQAWFESLPESERFAYVDCLSRTLCEYRTHNSQYSRAPVSLHPIVRAEELLGALFLPYGLLANRFYHLAGL